MSNSYVQRRVFALGDLHGEVERLTDFVAQAETDSNDIVILLGDSGLRFEGADTSTEIKRKTIVSELPVTVFVLRGNHDRPYELGNDISLMDCPICDQVADNYKMWHDEKYPNIWYFQDGGEYHILGKTYLTIGGACSVDKGYRLANGLPWWPQEQLTPAKRDYIFNRTFGNTYDFVLTHTAPARHIPLDACCAPTDSHVDQSMEKWLDRIEESIFYKKWFFGHFHRDEVINHKMTLLYRYPYMLDWS